LSAATVDEVLKQHRTPGTYLQGGGPGLVDVLWRELAKDWKIFLYVGPVLVSLLSKSDRTVAPKILVCEEGKTKRRARSTPTSVGIEPRATLGRDALL